MVSRSQNLSPSTSGGTFTSIDKLRQVMDRCLDGKPLDGDLADWLGKAIDGYLTRQYRTFEEAFGLIFPRGGIPWWREEANRTRDAALRSFAETFLGEKSLGLQAQEIRSASTRYGASVWRFDQENEEMPARYAGTPKECLWRAFKSGAQMPIGERQLQNILAPCPNNHRPRPFERPR